MAHAEADVPLSLPRIGKGARDADLLGFWALRSLAIERAQAASGLEWTDYNLHDPGVTLIEALCYSLTGLIYRFEFPVADHLSGADDRIDWHRQSLLPPEQAFPCRPATVDDLRQLLLDHDRSLCEVRLRAGDPAFPGLYRLMLLASHPEGHHAAAGRAGRIYRSQRNLGEDLADDIAAIPVDHRMLVLSADVDDKRDLADLVAEVFRVCEQELAPAPLYREAGDLIAAGSSLERIFTGPPIQHGRIDIASSSAPIAFSQASLRLRIARIEGIVSVQSLDLAPIATDPPGQEPVIRLKAPSSDSDPAENARLIDRIQLLRRGRRVAVAAPEVVMRCADHRHGHRDAAPDATPDSMMVPLPRGRHLPGRPPEGIAALLPPLYRRADEAEREQSGRPTQFQAYLALFDQQLGDAMVQLDHVRDIFSGSLRDPAGAPLPGHWPTAVEEDTVPGIGALYDKAVEPDRSAADYAGTSRRHAALDYLLALYGAALAQDTQPRLVDYLDNRERDAALLENKAAYLAAIATISRDRAAGFDYGKPLWGALARTTGFQRRIALELGFQDARAHPITDALSPDASTAAVPIAGSLLAFSWPHSSKPAITEAEARLHLRFDRVPPDALLNHAVHRARYICAGGILYLTTAAGTAAGGLAGWPLAACPDARTAARLATWLRHHALMLTKGGEGVHVVERILLRSRSTDHAVATGHLACVTLVLPSWTARTANPEFGAFATEIARRNCPAHLTIECRWPGLAMMAEFERQFADWAGILRDHAAGAAVAAELDEAAAALARLVAAMPRDAGVVATR